MPNALPPLTKDTIEAFAASAFALAVRLLLLLFSPRSARRARPLHLFVQRLERRVECIMFLKAALRTRLGEAEASLRRSLVGPTSRRPRPRRDSLAPGFRRTRGSLRHLLKSARVRARNTTPIGRLFHLLAALADGEAYIAHFMARLARGLRFGGIVAVAPPGIAFAAEAPRHCAFPDSS
jgi:hypothetical protein